MITLTTSYQFYQKYLQNKLKSYKCGKTLSLFSIKKYIRIMMTRLEICVLVNGYDNPIPLGFVKYVSVSFLFFFDMKKVSILCVKNIVGF